MVYLIVIVIVYVVITMIATELAHSLLEVVKYLCEQHPAYGKKLTDEFDVEKEFHVIKLAAYIPIWQIVLLFDLIPIYRSGLPHYITKECPISKFFKLF